MAPIVAQESYYSWQWCRIVQVERHRGLSRSPDPERSASRAEPMAVLEKLDLYNFDSVAAWDSPVVLTSPRSLAACRRAGVKPVELLYRSEQEVRQSLPPDVAPGVLQAVHRRAEEERQAKLRACRAIRQQLVERQHRQRSQQSAERSPEARAEADMRHVVVFTRDLAASPAVPTSVSAAPLFPAKKDILRASSPEARRSGYGASGKRDNHRASSPELKRDTFRASSPESKRESYRVSSPESKSYRVSSPESKSYRVPPPNFKRESCRASSPESKRESYRVSSPESKRDSYRVSSPESRRDVTDSLKRDSVHIEDVTRDLQRTSLPEARVRDVSEARTPDVLRALENDSNAFDDAHRDQRGGPRGPSAPSPGDAAGGCRVGRVITFTSPGRSSRKELLDKENSAMVAAARQGQGRLRVPGPQAGLAGLAISPNLSTATSPARSIRSLRSLRSQGSERARPRTVLVDCWGHAKTEGAVRPPPPRRRPPRPMSSGTPDTPSSLSESRCSSRRSRRRAARPPGSRCPRGLGVARRSLALRSLRAACLSPRKATAATAACSAPASTACSAVSVVVQDCDGGRDASTPHEPSLRLCTALGLGLGLGLGSGLGSVTPSDLGSWIPGSVLGSLGDELAVPEHDRRILESMAMKRQQELRSAEAAHRAHQMWEQERRLRRQMESERAAKWQARVNARRQWEAKENARRMEAVKRSLRLAQQRLEESIRIKEQRVQLRVLEEDVQRMVLLGERSKEYAARRLEVEEKLLHIQDRERSYRRLLAEELRSRQAQAESRRRTATEQERLRAASANREWERCRLERASLLAVQAEESVRVARASARERHQRAASNKTRIRRRRQQRALQASLEREARQSDARAMHADLEHGLQLWRERCAALREGAAARAQERARDHREHARARLHRSNQRRRRHHRVLHARVQAEEEGRRRAQRSEIRDKDQRIRQLRRLKERAVEESREQAYTTASLREELRRTLSPETFDRKAARVQLEMRVSTGRACTASLSPAPTNRSHIHLG